MSVVEDSSVAHLHDTGERMIPEQTYAPIYWDHVHRYRFALRFVKNRQVLDLACGEGYGCAALAAAGAKSVVGVDISVTAVNHARRKYNVDARVGSCEAIPLASSSVDVIVSFETVEHIAEPRRFIDECARVLRPSGALIISTPNREVFSGGRSDDEFHKAEMNKAEFVELISSRFPNHRLFSQRPSYAAPWSLRSFAASDALWFRVRGPNRIRRWIRTLCCPHVEREPTQAQRAFPVQAILERHGLFSSFTNPHKVRRLRRCSLERPVYMIAVGYR